MKPIIGIPANQIISHADIFQGNHVSYTPKGFVQALQKVGGLPLVMPINQNTEDVSEYVSHIDKLLLTGGQDVTPALYGEEPHPKLGQTDILRDNWELALIEEALKQHKPIFAVCRGMQLMNVYFGGTLHQDLSLYDDWTVKHVQTPTSPSYATHSVQLTGDSPLSKILNTRELSVNSYHHQIIKRTAPALQVAAKSRDNVAEAVTAKDEALRILGVQWHPELDFDVNEQSLALFDYFVHTL